MNALQKYVLRSKIEAHFFLLWTIFDETSNLVKMRRTSFLKLNKSTENSENEAHALFENEPFSTTLGGLGAHSFFEIGRFSTKLGEIEAHSSFENGQLSTRIDYIEAHALFENCPFSTKVGEI